MTQREGGWTGVGNINEIPLFVDSPTDSAERDLHLFHTSPCRDAGINNVPNLPGDDFEGDPRIAGSAVDMGADEFHTHLYVTGDATPGGAIEGKVVGLPGTAPVGLFLGSGVLPDPVNTMWGRSTFRLLGSSSP